MAMLTCLTQTKSMALHHLPLSWTGESQIGLLRRDQGTRHLIGCLIFQGYVDGDCIILSLISYRSARSLDYHIPTYVVSTKLLTKFRSVQYGLQRLFPFQIAQMKNILFDIVILLKQFVLFLETQPMRRTLFTYRNEYSQATKKITGYLMRCGLVNGGQRLKYVILCSRFIHRIYYLPIRARFPRTLHWHQ